MTKKNEDGAINVNLVDSAGGGKQRILIAPRKGSMARQCGVQPLSAVGFNAKVNSIRGLEVLKMIAPSHNKLSPLATAADEACHTCVAHIDSGLLEVLTQSAPPELIVEPDHVLQCGDAATQNMTQGMPIQYLSEKATTVEKINIQVMGDDEKPLPNVQVELAGDGFPAKGVTNAKGEVVLNHYSLGGNRPKSIFLVPEDTYWNRYLPNPALSTEQTNRIYLRSLSRTVPNFPQQFHYGWGQVRMGLDKIPQNLRGTGVKVAVIDSGAATDHPLLKHIVKGKDFTDNATPTSWQKDMIGHGSHVCGVVGASGEAGMLRGFVPDAEVHVLKVFPGGRFSSLLEALDYCIAHDIDVVNMSLGAPSASQAVEQKLEELYAHGILLVAAAGNSGDQVQYPALSSYTMAVSAFGLKDEYPADTWDATTIVPQYFAADGIFSPSFTCFGPQINVSAPGVAILSTMPNKAYGAMSGTSMAAPHITGAAAMLLAHHPLFKTTMVNRTPERISALYQLLAMVSQQYPFGDARTGRGLPRLDLVKELYAMADNPQARMAQDAAAAVMAGQHQGYYPNGQQAPTWYAPYIPQS